jgi:hypothetical protein
MARLPQALQRIDFKVQIRVTIENKNVVRVASSQCRSDSSASAQGLLLNLIHEIHTQVTVTKMRNYFLGHKAKRKNDLSEPLLRKHGEQYLQKRSTGNGRHGFGNISHYGA